MSATEPSQPGPSSSHSVEQSPRPSSSHSDEQSPQQFTEASQPTMPPAHYSSDSDSDIPPISVTAKPVCKQFLPDHDLLTKVSLKLMDGEILQLLFYL